MALERAGAAFIKWGQWAATRRDLFPPDLCQELEHLHACAPVHALALTQDAIQGAFGAAYDELFDEFPAEPIASGSIGQVYRARLSAKGARHTGIDPGNSLHSQPPSAVTVTDIVLTFTSGLIFCQASSLL